MSDNLPALQVLIPILLGVLVAMIHSGRSAWFISLAASFIGLLISTNLLSSTYKNGIMVYAMGGWKPPYGIELRIDILNATMLLLINFIAVICIIYSAFANATEISHDKLAKLYGLFLIFLGGMSGLLVTNDAFNIYVFLEVSALSAYSLVALRGTKQSLQAAFNYLINGTVGATFYLVGLGLLYAATGTLNIADLSELLPLLSDKRLLYAGTCFICLGLLMKMAMFPLHSWLLDVYSQSPSFVAAFFSGTTTKVMIYLLLKLTYDIFTPDVLLSLSIMRILSITAIVFASLYAMRQENIKLILAYSSVAQVGYIVLMLTLNTTIGIMAAIMHMIAHSLAKTALFICAGSSAADISGISFMARTKPYLSALLVICLCSLVGVPLTVGFLSKWYILSALIDAQQWSLLICFLFASLISGFYSWRIIEAVYCGAAKEKQIVKLDNSPQTFVVPVLCVSMAAVPIILFGIFTTPVIELASKIAEYLK